jgi:hypothetical protein
MKEKAGLAIAGMFSIAWIVFFAIGKIPLEVFAPVVSAALVWIFKDVEQDRLIGGFHEILRSNIDMLEDLKDRLEEFDKEKKK